ncbi:MAG TPA: alpha-ketoglutarate-dependent dioxygenase AlkB [Bacteroidia bacterium]|nr:alpha-ketoglutarate-dependent dioxygenase AlkB [Bacteroidia bacterium]
MQKDLFGNIEKTRTDISLEMAKEIIGLELFPNFITSKEEKELINSIDNSPWLNDLKRRVQHYGYKYDYRARKIDNSLYLGELPDWTKIICKKMIDEKIIDFIPDQAIINEYEVGQGISSHIDCEPCFGDTIISLSLGSSCVINFERTLNSKHKIGLFLEPRTLIVMKKESRYNWFHGIPQRKSDKFDNEIIKRKRRISLTFRKVIIE